MLMVAMAMAMTVTVHCAWHDGVSAYNRESYTADFGVGVELEQWCKMKCLLLYGNTLGGNGEKSFAHAKHRCTWKRKQESKTHRKVREDIRVTQPPTSPLFPAHHPPGQTGSNLPKDSPLASMVYCG